MRRAFLTALPLLLASCALMEPSGQRFVVFFSTDVSALDQQSSNVLGSAADYAHAHPDRVIKVEGFADPTGAPGDNAALIHARIDTVAKVLIADGVPASQIGRESGGTPTPALNSQESRRVVVTIGTP
jgi:cytochrome c oxidase subunit 2